MVAMQKIQRPSMPKGQQHWRAPMPRLLFKVLLYVFGPQGAIEKAQPPAEQVYHAGHKPAAIPDRVAVGHYSYTVAAARVSAACKNCPTHAAAYRAPPPVPSVWRRRANSCLTYWATSGCSRQCKAKAARVWGHSASWRSSGTTGRPATIFTSPM